MIEPNTCAPFAAAVAQFGTGLGITLRSDRRLQSMKGRADVQRRLQTSEIMLCRNATQSICLTC